MKIIEGHWGSMGIIEDHWGSSKIIEDHWQSLRIIEDHWGSSKIIEDHKIDMYCLIPIVTMIGKVETYRNKLEKSFLLATFAILILSNTNPQIPPFEKCTVAFKMQLGDKKYKCQLFCFHLTNLKVICHLASITLFSIIAKKKKKIPWNCKQ